ncbi:hypothetical protein [Herbidospora cretacea]|uniref:hypothetical protein n=1 Tax=Herbidospora cretacea TaxID=28444 RepID=UPI000774A131|nr:hypothetical protein [Herbidospora cretacea]
MATRSDIDSLRTAFPNWVLFRSDEGVFYATRRGVSLDWWQLAEGLMQTVAADTADDLARTIKTQESPDGAQ